MSAKAAAIVALTVSAACHSVSYGSGRDVKILDGLTQSQPEIRRRYPTEAGYIKLAPDTEIVFLLRGGGTVRGSFRQIDVDDALVRVVTEDGQEVAMITREVTDVGIRHFSFGKTFWFAIGLAAGVVLIAGAADSL